MTDVVSSTIDSQIKRAKSAVQSVQAEYEEMKAKRQFENLKDSAKDELENMSEELKKTFGEMSDNSQQVADESLIKAEEMAKRMGDSMKEYRKEWM